MHAIGVGFSGGEIFISATEVNRLVMLALTIDVEEGFHGLRPSAHNLKEYHEPPQGTFIRPLQSILNLFEREHVSSTFFVLGQIAEAFPQVIKAISERGHEVASHGFFHVDLTKIPLSRLETMEKRNREVLTRIIGEAPIGFRAPFGRVTPEILALLSKIGYLYDSSVVPSAGIPGWWSNYRASLCPYRVSAREREFFEAPIAVFPVLRLPAGGGWFLRNLGLAYVKMAVRLLLRRGLPAILYFHPFDVDRDVPRLGGFRFHVTRRCGEYTLKAIKHLLRSFDCAKVPIQAVLKDFMG